MHTPRSHRPHRPWWLLIATVGCLPNLPPATSVSIECDDVDECPQGYECLLDQQICVKTGVNLDAPRVVDDALEVIPPQARRGQEVRLSFRVDVPLARDPVVTVAWLGATPGSAEALRVPGGSDPRHYTYAYEVDQAAPEGFLSVSILLLGENSVPGGFELPRAIVLDETPPQLVGGTNLVRIQPPPGSALDDVTEATLGTLVEAFFAVNEPLAPPIDVHASNEEALACDLSGGTFFQCQRVIDEAFSSGAYEVVATVRDLAGNESTLTLGAFGVDREAPPRPRTAEPGLVVLRREPYGTAASGGSPSMWLSGAAGSVEPGALVVIGDAPDLAQGVELARTHATPEGAFGPVALPGVDRSEVYVTAVDAAGNPSPGALVWEGTWTATLGGKVAGSTFENPNLFMERLSWSPTRVALGDREPAAPGALAAGPGALDTWGQPELRSLQTDTTHPSARGGCAMAYDDGDGSLLLFGGTWREYGATFVIYESDTWRFDRNAWVEVRTEVQPSGRQAAALAFDSSRRRFVLFGGCNLGSDCTRSLGDTWEFDGDTWRRVCWPGCQAPQECPCTAAPAPRAGAVTYWDPFAGVTRVIGGRDSTTFYDDEWTWDGRDWHEVTPTTRPGPRAGALFALDPNTGALMISRGTGPGGDLLDTWMRDASGWTQIDNVPGDTHLWFDEDRQQFLSFAAGSALLFTWNGASWDGPAFLPVRGDPNQLTGPRLDSCGTYDRTERAFIRFGGCHSATRCRIDTGNASDLTWAINGDEVVRLAPGVAPAPRAWAASALNAANDTIVLAGGGEGLRDRFDDLWTWDGRRWVGTDGRSSQGREGSVMAPVQNGVVVRYGGNGNIPFGDPLDTYYLAPNGGDWEWVQGTTGDTTSYLQPVDRVETPDTREAMTFAAMARDAASGEALYFRGYVGGATTWIARWRDDHPSWGSGIEWEPQATPVEPPTLAGHSMASCPSTGGVLLFGGDDGVALLGQTWLWSQGQWEELTPAPAPGPRRGASMFCDETTDRVVLFGGQGPAGLLDDVWEWDGQRWRERSPAQRPTPRTGATAAYLPATGQAVWFGGFDDRVRGDTWLWDGARASRPAHIFTARYFDAGVWETSELQDVWVRWIAGAEGESGGETVVGTGLYVWDRGTWRPVALNDGRPDAPEELWWSSAEDPEWAQHTEPDRARLLQRLVGGPGRELTALAAPQGVNGDRPEGARLRSTYVEVTVAYRLRCQDEGEPTADPQRCCSGTVDAGGACTAP